MFRSLFGSTDKPDEQERKPGFLDRMKEAVSRTRENLSEHLEAAVGFTKEIDRDTLDSLEASLLAADLGSATTREVLKTLREKADRKQIGDANALKRLLQDEMFAILTRNGNPPAARVEDIPEVILIVGVNGTGKTTTIGKLAHLLRGEGKSVLLCAADTFRAAAIEQLEVWGTRSGTEVIKTKQGAIPLRSCLTRYKPHRPVRWTTSSLIQRDGFTRRLISWLNSTKCAVRPSASFRALRTKCC